VSEAGDLVADTHTLIWHLVGSAELSATARAILRDADAGRRRVFVPSIALVEIVYLAERGRIGTDLLQQMLGFVADPNRSYPLAALDESVVLTIPRVPRSAVPDMPDRIVAATALHLGLPLISRDERIRASGVVPIIW
jgi:PIN domain nuclease of toxin-antitoxin system